MKLTELQVGKCYRCGNELFVIVDAGIIQLYGSDEYRVIVNYVTVSENFFCKGYCAVLYNYEYLKREFTEVDIEIYYKLIKLYKDCFNVMDSIFKVEIKDVFPKC